MNERVPNAEFLGVARLNNFRMVLRNFADIIPDDGAVTYGVLWKVNMPELHKIDQGEGYHKHYNRIPVEVVKDGKHIMAMAHIMDPAYRTHRPPTWDYVGMIARGYQEHGIPLKQLSIALKKRLGKA